MAIYYNTTEINGEELRLRMEKCNSQNMKVYELAKEVKTLWRWKLIELYEQFFGERMLDAVASRALSTLVAQGYLTHTGEKIRSDKGAYNVIYQVNENPPMNPVLIPKKICVEMKFIDIDGKITLDMDGMSDEFISKMGYYDTLFNN